MKHLISLLSLTICFSLSHLHAQFDWPMLSAPGKIIQKVGYTTVEVAYERPSVRNRKIFGGLVPWGKIWRTGAGPCTKLSFDKAVILGGQSVPAGSYSLFTIPNPDEWLVILNTDTSLYGAYDHDAQKDIARFVVKPHKSDRLYETMNIDIDVIPNNARIYISWEYVQISFLLETSTDLEVMRYIEEELMTDKVKDADEYNMAADYLLFKQLNHYQAIRLAEKAQAIEESGFGWRLQMDLYENLHLYPQAIKAAEGAKALRASAKHVEPAYLERDLAQWQEHIDRLVAKAAKEKK